MHHIFSREKALSNKLHQGQQRTRIEKNHFSTNPIWRNFRFIQSKLNYKTLKRQNILLCQLVKKACWTFFFPLQQTFVDFLFASTIVVAFLFFRRTKLNIYSIYV
jgi:hypothetical protein